MAPVVTMRQLLESGVHFGHQTRRWNPKMKRFIFAERNGIYIIDLQQSLEYIDTGYEFVKETVAHGGTVLFVGTKKQAQEAIAEQARRVGMPFVNQRWLGGMLTNFSTVFKRLQRLKELEEIDFDDVAGSGMTKKELLHLKRERDKLDRTLGGIRDMTRVPSAVWVVDTKKEHIAVSEARKLGIPVVAILDTNCDPDEVTYPIPGNDDAIRSVALLTRVVADAVADGLIARAGAAVGEEKPAADVSGADIGVEEPLAEWERELLEGAQPEAGNAPAASAEAAADVDSATVTDNSDTANSPKEVDRSSEADSPEGADSAESGRGQAGEGARDPADGSAGEAGDRTQAGEQPAAADTAEAAAGSDG
jgi:small subunit ribosomal protein S2